jgi:hypothetical protein
MYDDAWRAETRLDDRHVLYARLFPHTPENSGRISHPHEELILRYQQIATQLANDSGIRIFHNHNLLL